MSKELAIEARDLGKRYRLGKQSGGALYGTVRDSLTGLFNRLRSSRDGSGDIKDFWALRGVDFEVRRGEIFAVVGRNGAGKSTLLKIMSRVVRPTTGEAIIRGRVGALLEVGTGFHPELTGRENIYLSGAILGMRRPEIRARLDEIVQFAGMEEFVDVPCKRYSSGMYARLGFAVAAHLEADILLLDEILSVGDAEFRLRCQRRIREVMLEHGRTILLVSHDFAVVRALCQRALWLDGGSVRMVDTADGVLGAYHGDLANNTGRIADRLAGLAGGVEIDYVRVGGGEARLVVLASGTDRLKLEVAGRMSRSVRMAIEARLYDQDNVLIGLFSPGHEHGAVTRVTPGPFRLEATMMMPPLLQGLFRLKVEVTDPGHESLMDSGPQIDLTVEGAVSAIGSLRAGPSCGYQLLPQILDQNNDGLSAR